MMILHEILQQRCMTLLFVNEQFRYSHERGDAAPVRKMLCGAEQRTSVGLLTELKSCNRARNEPPLLRL
jgi:hypothetical protein